MTGELAPENFLNTIKYKAMSRGEWRMELVFLAIMLVGLLYLLLMIFGGLGDVFQLDIEGALEGTGLDSLLGLAGAADSGEASGLGCGVIAAFLAGFGAVGLAGTVAGWNPFLLLAAAVAFGWVLGRAVVALLRFVYRQQSTDVFHNEDLIGTSARVTINSAPGKTGEVLVELGEVRKYPVQELSGAALQRGDTVEIVAVSGRFLQVKKKRG
jgi:membrane protein implicated in regulation of membrane protease activity